MKNLMDELISEFNTTVGVDEGIIISVTAISGSSELHEMLVAAADQVPGALPAPGHYNSLSQNSSHFAGARPAY